MGLGAVRTGEALRVGGSDGISISIIMRDRLRRAGSSGNIDLRADLGCGAAIDVILPGSCVECAFDDTE